MYHEQAEDIYVSIDQRNLAIELRENMGIDHT